MASLPDGLSVGSARLLLHGLLSTVRFEASGAENYLQFWGRGEPVLFVIWHGRLLPLTYLHRHQDLVTMASRSRDGERIARLLGRWGYSVVRGSSSRGGGIGLRALIRHGRDGRSLVLTADGPRGPRQKLKPGALVGAQITGMPIIPVAAGTARGWWLNSWDRFLIPKPFARVRVVYGEPRWVPRRTCDAELERLREVVEDELNSAMEQVDGDAAV